MAYSLPVILQADDRRARLLHGVLVLWGVLALVGISFLALGGASEYGTRLYIVPWCLAAAIVICAPTAVLAYRGKLDLFHPLVFFAWAYFFPGFVIGGLVLALGFTDPYFVSFVQDERVTFPLTFIYIMLGFGGMTLGFVLPRVGVLGRWIGDKLPAWQAEARAIPLPSFVLLALGLSGMITSFTLGLFGYQTTEDLPVYNGILFLVTLFWLQGSLLLWLYIFRSGFGAMQLAFAVVLIVGTFARAAFQGNRGSLLQAAIVVAFAFAATRAKLTTRHYAIGAFIFALAVVVGMLYGSTFRTLKGSQSQIDPSEYATLVPTTLGSIIEKGPAAMANEAFLPLAQRIDSVSSLAVVVSNYEALAPYEEQAGIANNIIDESATFFIPRLLWPDKPVGGVNLARYGELYFNAGDNAFLMTPMGDLLRNFGPWGVPLGMIALGMLLRLIYSALIEAREFSYWRSAAYFMLLSTISFEGTFGDIVPYLCKAGFTMTIGILIVRYLPTFIGTRLVTGRGNAPSVV
ncbi:MAG TPA: hypothetical protein VL501_03140 [Pyrinomonadaceae bacterium]|nr:hypothetical protein [Pyrinomonadaceae bacterium]